MVKKLIVYVLLGVVCFSFSGCAVVMATRQPGYKNLNAVQAGVARDEILAELGTPTASETDAQGNKVDIFKFKQGYSTGNKAVRALGHAAADVFTLGLWEVVGTPAEAVFSGKDMAIKVTYDKDNRAKEVAYLKGR